MPWTARTQGTGDSPFKCRVCRNTWRPSKPKFSLGPDASSSYIITFTSF